MPVARVSEMTQNYSRLNDLELSDTFDGYGHNVGVELVRGGGV